MDVLAPVFQPAPTVVPVSNTSLNVTWISGEPSTQLRGVARNYSVYMSTSGSSVSSWQVDCTSRSCLSASAKCSVFH